MATQVINDISNDAWSQFNNLKDTQVNVKTNYRIVNNEEFEEFDEDTLIDSAWSKFCEIKTNIPKKPEYKRDLKQEEIIEEIDGAWKEFIENKENDNEKTEVIKVNENKDDDETETEAIDGAWKEFMENNDKSKSKKVEYIKVTEEEVDDETSEEEYENSAWNSFKSIESEEKLKKNNMKYEIKKKPEMVKMQLADCAWNEFVISDKALFEKYEKSLERLEDDIIISDETFAEEESGKSNSSVIEGETTILLDNKSNILSESLKVEDQIEEKTNEKVKEEIKPTEEVKNEIDEEIKLVEEVKEESKSENKITEEIKEETKKDEEINSTKKITKKKGKFSKLLKKTKKIFKKVFSSKKFKN
ncbi:hypothetical protein H8356DRAFT_1626586 [Neocallimastix lanati (nom. inval.)]|nr:hypothetical protein H8356DRAFT_1626586 [Neocallimastix sp. JGI-2020a]